MRARLKKKRGVEGGAAPPPAGEIGGGAEPCPFVNGSHTEWWQKKK